ncbi:MAG: Rossmann-like and DUF2520 domain-containing protein [Acidobacteriota bacterium]
MKLSIIGAGRVGQTLGRRARETGFEIIDVVCRTKASANRAVKFIGAGRAQAAAKARLSPTDLILIATPDDKIADAVAMIQTSPINKAIALHTSGASSSAILEPLKEKNILVGSCHPLQSFASPAQGLPLISQTYFCIEGEAAAVGAARRLVRAIGARYFEIKPEMKSLYHAAAVMSSGGVTALLAVAIDMLIRCGLPEKEARKILLPLVEGTLKNLQTVDAAQALTGPIRRGDMGTVERNLQALKAVDESAMEIYRLLAKRSLQLARQAGSDKKLLRRVQQVLDAS